MNLKTTCLSLMLAFPYMSFAATDIPTGFEDRGEVTYQASTNLEWLDVTKTQYRSYNDVTQDINDDTTGYFNKQDGWRYATKAEFEHLISEWFNIDYYGVNTFNQAPIFGDNDHLLVQSFIATFSDTFAFHIFLQKTLWNNELAFMVAEEGSGAVKGLINADDVPSWQRRIAMVNDGELVYKNTGEFYRDDTDYVSTSLKTSPNKQYTHVGSFLVREARYEP